MLDLAGRVNQMILRSGSGGLDHNFGCNTSTTAVSNADPTVAAFVGEASRTRSSIRARFSQSRDVPAWIAFARAAGLRPRTNLRAIERSRSVGHLAVGNGVPPSTYIAIESMLDQASAGSKLQMCCSCDMHLPSNRHPLSRLRKYKPLM